MTAYLIELADARAAEIAAAEVDIIDGPCLLGRRRGPARPAATRADLGAPHAALGHPVDAPITRQVPTGPPPAG